MTKLHDLAWRFFGLVLPCTEDELKSAYRRAAKKLHTDVGGSKEAFIAMKDAYDALSKAPEILMMCHEDKRDRTTRGDLLSSLGLGLGPTINGRDCPSCDRKGYRTTQEIGYTKCSKCDGHGDIMLCRACYGSGLYTNPVNRKVPCRRCNAQGFRPSPKVKDSWTPSRARGAQGCPDCHATGRIEVSKPEFTYHTCGECNGTGEIKIYNPVILKGGLSQKQRREQR